MAGKELPQILKGITKEALIIYTEDGWEETATDFQRYYKTVSE